MIALPLALQPDHASRSTAPALTPSASATTAAPATARHATVCKPTTLTLPKGTKDHFGAIAIDPTGRYVVGMAASNSSDTGMFWDNGKPTMMDVPGSPEFKGVNAQGVVVGATHLHDTSSVENVFTWKTVSPAF